MTHVLPKPGSHPALESIGSQMKGQGSTLLLTEPPKVCLVGCPSAGIDVDRLTDEATPVMAAAVILSF